MARFDRQQLVHCEHWLLTRGLVLKEKFLFGISAFGIFRMNLLQVM
jgi:hypothetical protein